MPDALYDGLDGWPSVGSTGRMGVQTMQLLPSWDEARIALTGLLRSLPGGD